MKRVLSLTRAIRTLFEQTSYVCYRYFSAFYNSPPPRIVAGGFFYLQGICPDVTSGLALAYSLGKVPEAVLDKGWS